MADSIRAQYDALVENPEVPNVVATYTDADGNLVVMVVDDAPEAVAPFATRAPGVKFVKGGPFVAWDHTDRLRPVQPGISTGHYAITAGTLGLVVRDKTDGAVSVLSNNHVYANINKGNPGDDLLQPGVADGGNRSADAFADLTRFVQLRNGATVDAAIGRVRNPDDASLEIYRLGYCYGVCEPFLDQKIWKSGRTTEVTRGRVIAVDAVVEVMYGPSKKYTIHDCIISDIYGGPGDSGSALLDFASNRIAGLLFAGGSGYTIGNKAGNVFAQLNIETIQPLEVTRSQFLDVSHWQGEITSFADTDGAEKANLAGLTASTFATMKSRGVRGVIMKVCQGSALIDDRFAEYYDAAKSAGLLVGGYIFVDPAGGGAQAHYDNFLRAVGERKFDIPVALDVEKRGGELTAIVQSLSNLITTWQGARPLIYTSVSFWNDNILPWSGWKDHPLWIAYWSDIAMTPAVPEAWKGVQPVMWQYDVNDNGFHFGVESKQVDTNLTFPSFERLLTGSEPPPDGTVTLTVSVSGQGEVEPAGGSYPRGETIELTAAPAQGWAFAGWSGDAGGSENPLSLVMDGNKSIVATFREDEGDDSPAVFEHHRAVNVTGTNLRLRAGAGTKFAQIGVIPNGAAVEVLETAQDAADNTWARTGFRQWAALHYGGSVYLRYVTE